MFRIVKRLMWLDKGASGKREFAVIALTFSMFITLYFTPTLEPKHIRDIIFYWLTFSFIACLAAFGFQAVMDNFSKLAGSIQSPATPSSPELADSVEEFNPDDYAVDEPKPNPGAI